MRICVCGKFRILSYSCLDVGVFLLATFTKFAFFLFYFEIYLSINIELTYFSATRALAAPLIKFVRL